MNESEKKMEKIVRFEPSHGLHHVKLIRQLKLSLAREAALEERIGLLAKINLDWQNTDKVLRREIAVLKSEIECRKKTGS